MTEDIFGSMKCFIGLVMRYTVLEVQKAEKNTKSYPGGGAVICSDMF